MDITTRNPDNNEIPVLREILCETFGPEGQSAFFEMLYSKERSIVACVGGKIAAMGHLIPMGELQSQGEGSPVFKCAMIYAVATEPEYRGRGLGEAVTNSLIALANDSGFDSVVLCPFEDSLFEYYGRRTEMRDWFYVKEIICENTVIAGSDPQSPADFERIPCQARNNKIYLSETTPQEYIDIRENLLKDIPHIRQNINCIEFQKALCDEMGGGLYRINDSCAVVEVQSDGEVRIKELLVADTDDKEQITQSICAKYPSHRYLIRTPAKMGEGRRFGMIACSRADTEFTSASKSNDYAPWYGLAFD